MIREDTFPATIVFAAADFDYPPEGFSSRPPTPGAAYLPITRVIVTGDRVLVLKDDVSGPMRVFEEDIDPNSYYKGSIHMDSYVTTVSGKRLSWRKDQACGCGSRLRSYRAFNSMSSSKDPTE